MSLQRLQLLLFSTVLLITTVTTAQAQHERFLAVRPWSRHDGRSDRFGPIQAARQNDSIVNQTKDHTAGPQDSNNAHNHYSDCRLLFQTR